jgi:hypothetical protein
MKSFSCAEVMRCFTLPVLLPSSLVAITG